MCQKSEKPNEPFLRKLLDGHTKNQFISLTSLWDTANFRVLQLIEKSCNPDWPRALWAISQEPEFSQIWNLFKHTAIITIQTFIIDQIDKKLKNWEKETKLSYTFKGLFKNLAYFLHFGGKTLFSKNQALPYTKQHWPLMPCWDPEKTKSQLQENFQTEGRTDLIHMTLLVIARGSIRE